MTYSVAATRRRRRRLPSWVQSKAPGAGGRWVRLGRRRYYAARRDTRPTLPAGMYTLERDHEGDVIFERRDLEADALIRIAGSAADELPVACVFEDIDAIVAEHGEDQLLSLLDGENEVDHVLNLATTNYPEQLDRRFVARPRRFDRVVRIDAADERTRRSYLATKLGEADAAELERWVRLTEGLSLAALAEAVISVRCLGNGLEETLALLHRMRAGRASSRDFAASAGFAPRGR